MEGDYTPDFSALPGWMPAASMGIGGMADLFSIIQNQRAASRQRDLYSLLQNPAALAAHINGMYQPLSDAGRTAISRNVQADMAMRGTANSGLADLEAARAFSENETSRRNAVMDAYMNALGQSAGLTGQRAPVGALGNSLQQVMLMRALRTPGSNPGIAASPGPSDRSADYSKMNFWSTPPASTGTPGSMPYYSEGE